MQKISCDTHLLQPMLPTQWCDLPVGCASSSVQCVHISTLHILVPAGWLQEQLRVIVEDMYLNIFVAMYQIEINEKPPVLSKLPLHGRDRGATHTARNIQHKLSRLSVGTLTSTCLFSLFRSSILKNKFSCDILAIIRASRA